MFSGLIFQFRRETVIFWHKQFVAKQSQNQKNLIIQKVLKKTGRWSDQNAIGKSRLNVQWKGTVKLIT